MSKKRSRSAKKTSATANPKIKQQRPAASVAAVEPLPPKANNQALVWAGRLLIPVALFLFYFNPVILDPTNIGWLLEDDLAVHYAGWMAFRFDEWHLLPLRTELFSPPFGTPILTTDSNPLVSVILKPLSPILPLHFQYVGWWYLLCVALVFNVCLNILVGLNGNRIETWLGALAVASMTFFYERLIHDTLMAHWVFLLALAVFLFEVKPRAALVKHGLIAALAMSIHPYLFVMTVPIAGADFLRRGFRAWQEDSSFITAFVDALIRFGLMLVPAFAVGYVLGVFSLDPQTKLEIGRFSMDPLAWFNGVDGITGLGWQVGPGQYEGAQFLGTGLVLLAVGVCILWGVGKISWPKRLSTSVAFLALGLSILYLLAILPRLIIFEVELIYFDFASIPALEKIMGYFRSSGRLAWPVTYVLALILVSGLLSFRSKALLPALALVCVLQLADGLIARQTTYELSSQSAEYDDYLGDSEALRALIKKHDQIYIAGYIENELLWPLSLLAIEERVVLSRYHTAQARYIPEQLSEFVRAETAFRAGALKPSILYLAMSADVYDNVTKRRNHDRFKRVEIGPFALLSAKIP